MTRARVFAVAALLSLASCATAADVVRTHQDGGGTTRSYATSYDVAWQAARDVLRRQKPDSLEEHAPEHYVLATFDSDEPAAPDGCHGSSLIGVWVEPIDAAHVRVDAVSKLTRGSYVSCLTEGTFFEELDRVVAGRGAAPGARPVAAESQGRK
jgi:hypothetical protein